MSITPNAPRWKHDCGNCQFVGIKGQEDVYVCHKQHMLEIVIRYGDLGPEYWSQSVFVKKQPRYIVRVVDIYGGGYQVIDTKYAAEICASCVEDKAITIAKLLNDEYDRLSKGV